MTTLLVRGLENEGPGDIVGAFVAEADVDPDAIGDIDIDGTEAIVEVTDGVTDPIVETMDDGRIGGSEVDVIRLDDDTKAVREYVEEYSRLVELEREADMDRHDREIRECSGREREAKGRAILDLEGRDEGEGLGGYHVKFVRQRSDEELPETEIGVGDLVMLSKRDPLREDNPTGTVAAMTNHSITVAFDGEPPGFVFGADLRVDLYVNDVTFQRMLDALEELPGADGSLAELRDVIVGIEAPVDADPAGIEEWHDAELNDPQRRAVRRSIGAEDVHLIHGPPGTGKTTTAVEAIRQCVDRGESVLATAASNTAVDNVLEFLIETNPTAQGPGGDREEFDGVDVVRVGHPARVTPALRERTLDGRLEDNGTYRRSRELREEAFELLDEAEELTHPSGRWRRGLSDERIRRLAEEGRGSRGIPAERIEEMTEWLELRDEADELFERSDELEEEAIDEVLGAADVVCTTNSTAGSDLLEGRRFDTVVIDEATQATEPSCLIPMVKADRAVMAGDHRQLPPTILSREAAREGLRETLFERLAERHDDSVSPLEVQYRMHEDIMDFSSERFYDGVLTADTSVRDHTLADLGVTGQALPAEHRDVLDPDAPLVFADTARIEVSERSPEGSTSRENTAEADLLVSFARAYLDVGLAPEQIAIVSPYGDQVDRIRGTIDVDGLEIDTVDGFQGREKEVVLVSLVRSNATGEVGFLDEPRRFNVALTRARRKAVIVGDVETVGSADVYDAFVEYARETGRYVAIE